MESPFKHIVSLIIHAHGFPPTFYKSIHLFFCTHWQLTGSVGVPFLLPLILFMDFFVLGNYYISNFQSVYSFLFVCLFVFYRDNWFADNIIFKLYKCLLLFMFFHSMYLIQTTDYCLLALTKKSVHFHSSAGAWVISRVW